MSLLNTLKRIVDHPLNRTKKLTALMRFARWQIGSRLVPGDVIYHWVSGSKVVSRPGETGITGNIYCGLHEFADMAFLLHVLRGEDLFVDVGANVGSYTVLACSVVGAKGYCFEPVPSTYERLLTNIRLNDMSDRVVSRNIALGNSYGKINFSSDENCMNHIVADNEVSKGQVSVHISKLDEEIKEVPFLIKIDVEGYETPVLEGAQKTLEKEGVCCVIVELNGSGNRYGFDESKILAKMKSFGFSPYSYEPFERKLINLNGKNSSEGNTLFIKNLDLVLERLKAAPKLEINGISI